MMTIDLACMLKYKNNAVIERYKKDFPNAKYSPEETFQELMKYMWLSSTHQIDKKAHPDHVNLDFICVMHAEMFEIDNMWHTFLLFTQDYQQFCQTYLGGFFHHAPQVEDEKVSNESYINELTRYLTYISDQLGEQTLRKWFDEDTLSV